jgi:hypothetical protein
VLETVYPYPFVVYIGCISTHCYENVRNIWKSYDRRLSFIQSGEQATVIVYGRKFENKAHQYNVNIKEQYHSGLEHTFVWIAEADNAHSIEDLMIEAGVAKFNTLKIVSLRTLQHVIESCKKLESRTP